MGTDAFRPEAVRETGIQEVMTSTSIDRHPTAFHATGLPILRGALDVAQMSRLLAPLLAPLGAVNGVRYAKLLAYKRGNRGLVSYELDTPHGPVVVAGKIYPDLARVRTVHERMTVLWEQVFERSNTLGIPRPLGWIDDLTMLVYVPVDGRTLDEVLTPTGPTGANGSDTRDLFARTGRWLGRLHSAQIPLERRFELVTEAVHLVAWAGLIGHTYPDLTADALQLAQALRDRVPRLRLDTRVPIHKDFHYRHVVVDPDVTPEPYLWVLDFDEMRIADPAIDVAHFCANLNLLALRTETPIPPLQSAFLEAYSDATGWRADERFEWFHAYTCLKITKQLCTVRGVRPRPSGEEQRRQADAMLARGFGSAGL